MTVRELSGRIRRRILIVFSGATAIAGAVFLAYAAVVPTGDALPVGSKAIPATLSVLSSPSLPPEVQALEASTAPLLFDRDTVTQHVAYGVSTTETTFETAQPVNAIKVYGAAPYLLTVKAESGGAYTPITGLENLNLTQLPTGWATFTAAAPVATGKLQFELTPATGGTATGLRELEVWTTSAPVNVKSGAALLNGLLGSNPPPQGRFYNAYNPTANPTTGVIAVSADDTADNIFSFTLDRSPVHFVRAYLAYELYGQQHWVSPRRKINNMSYTGGALLLPNSEWSTQVERINPAWLKEGSNTIEFSVLSSSYKEAGYTVRNVRVVLELDTGANIIDALTASQPDSTGANPLDAMRDGDLATGWKPYPADQPINAVAPSVEFAFARPTQMDAVSFYLSAPIEGEVKISAQFLNPLTNTLSWIDFPAEQGAVLTTGWNTIYVPAEVPVEARVVNAVRLSFLGGYVSSAEIREFLFIGSVIGSRATAPKVYVTYPENGEFYGRSAYIGAIVEPWNNGSGNAAVSIGGRAQIHYAGDISTWISKDTAGFTSQADSDPWSVEVKAVYPNGQTVSTIVQLTDQRSPAAPIGGTIAGSTSVVVSTKGKKTISHDESKLVFDGGTVSADTTVTVTPLADADVPALDVGMVNVTKGPRRAYRFLPHGAKFLKNVALTLPYDKALIPPGHTEDDVKTYYFDEQAGRWVALERVAVDKSGKLVDSLTNHFTDMINAVVTVPDHPEAVSFNPTSMKDIKAADPGSQVNLIDPPGANNTGDARLSYPIEVPPGRAGLQPQLAVQYNSSGGNGWMGMGWDLATQAISIDTRFGVPRYSSSEETETYTLNGEQLTPVAHRGVLQARGMSGQKVFHTRVEGQFRRIVRYGTTPGTYTWEVTDKNGTKYFYGRTAASSTVDSGSILATGGGSGNIFYWALTEIRDPNGNFVRHRYQRIQDYGVNDNKVPGYQLYPDTITYTGNGTTEGLYQVKFLRDRDVDDYAAVRRKDVQIDARGGFKRVTADLLRQVEVRFNNTLIRRYDFRYNDNPYGDGRTGTAFNKTLLTTVVQYGDDGEEFNRHRFEYNDEARNSSSVYHGFAGSTDWSVGSDGVSAGLMGEGAASALGGSSSSGGGGHVYIGIGEVGNTQSKEDTGGIKIGFNQSESEGLLTLADMNGDGLPDKVFKGNGYSYRPNRSGPGGGTSFGDPVSLSGLPAISRETVTSTTIGGELYFGLPAMFDTNLATTQTNTYFTDVNGDGLTDVVNGGGVSFGYLDDQQRPRFSSNSADTPVPIGPGAVDGDGLLEDPTAIEEERARKFPLLDTVRRWVAPYDGVVRVNAPVHLIEDTSQERIDYTGADGVRVAIQLEGAELWSTAIGATNYDTHTPTGVDTVTVHRGDRLYFRVQSVRDGAYDRVAWDPEITYLSVDTARTDVNDLQVYQYRASQDFTLAGRSGTVRAPLTGTLHLAGTWEKTGVTTDDVTLLITRNGAEVYRRTLGYAETATVNLSQDIPVTQLDVLEWRILVDSPIDATRVRLLPSAYYTAAEGVDRVTDDQGNYVITVRPPYDMDLYPVNALTAPQGHYTVPATGSLSVSAGLTVTGLAVGQTTSAVFTVKRRGALLGKQTVSFTGTGMPITQTVALDVDVTAGDELFFDLSSRDTTFASYLTAFATSVGSDVVPSAVHVRAEEGLFPQPYRGWGAFGYNGNAAYGSQPIDQNVLHIDASYTGENARVYPYIPQPVQASWGGMDELAWVKAIEMSSSRLGLDDIRMPRSEQFAGASAVPRISRSINNSADIGVGGSQGNSYSQVDFQDLNGDRFPDVIGQGGVQYTPAIGGLEATKNGGAGLGMSRSSRNTTVQGSTSGAGSLAVAIANGLGILAPGNNKTATTAKQGSDMPSLGFTGGTGTADTEYDLIDINGDGLPDKVYENGTAGLNLGYSFATPEVWNAGVVNPGRTVNTGVNMGFNTNYYSLAGGLNLGTGITRTDETYADINGDGLPDKIRPGNPLKVRLNTGTGFTDDIDWQGGHGSVAVDKHITLGGGFYFTFGFNFTYVRLVINPGFNFSNSMGRPEYAFRDVDGDGFADHLKSERDSELKVALNPIGRTNLLKKVYRPLGASFELEYTRDGNTYDLPQSRWLLTKVAVHDGHAGDGADQQLRTIEYQAPKYNRLERDFYGYGRVIERQLDTLNGNNLYRVMTREFRTDSFYTKGLLTRELLQDAAGRPFTETENEYQVRDEATQLGLADLLSTTATGFPQLVRTDKRFYEGAPGPGKSTYTTHAYDKYGNVTTFADAGDTAASDDVLANIEYSWLDPACETNYFVGLARKIEVYGNGPLMRHRQATIDCTSGDVRQIRQYLADGKVAVTDLDYFPNGNLKSVAGPANKNSQRYVLNYEYDPVVTTHVAKITDSFGLTSTATHNYLYGRPETTTDTNGNQSTYFYDSVGRVDAIVGPYEQSQSQATIDFEYSTVETGALTHVPYAITRHVDKDADGAYKPSGTIDTVLFADGLKRVLQTKKDVTVLETSAPQNRMTVSGRVTFDAVGRTIAQYYPVTEGLGQQGVFNAAYDAEPPTTTEYDVLDRAIKATMPDGTFTTIRYGFGTDRAGTSQFETLVEDANVNAGLKGAIKTTYRDVRDLITSVKELNKSGSETLWTSYTYDPLKQIVEVKDDQGNLTKVSYDNFGRRTGIDNPDTGLTEFGYDLASNLTSKVTANLKAVNQALTYDYDFTRLKTVSFPVNPGNSISYAYGAPGAANNAAGRITKVVSHTTATSQGNLQDSEERQYGKLGEVTYEKKTVVTFSDPLHPSVFETRYKFDTFGRMLRITYPDGEVLTNVYDSGGNLQSAEGVKGVSTTSSGVYRYPYLHGLYYDKFEQRVLMEQGNGVKTAYSYDAKTRRLHGLTAGKSGGTLFQNLAYGYDSVGNVLSLKNIVDLPHANTYGGPGYQRYEYDDLYRLTKAQGVFPYNRTGANPDASSCDGVENSHCRVYALEMAYDTIHNIQSKNQLDTRYPPGNATGVVQKKTSYNWSYQYNASGPSSVRPHAPNHIGLLTYQYDANGNQLGWTHDQNGTRRTIVWDEENRIQSLFDNGHEKTYKYDDQGTRTIKRGPQGETVYVNQFYTQRPGATGTKHVYAGTGRIASKLLRQDVPGANPVGKTPFEKDIYYYHPDHLGSSSYVTDLNARIYEHLEYFPFGEGWIEENSNVQRTPYLFTAKELDEETGLYYYGARYFDPRTSMWQSADPALGKYLPAKSARVSGLPGEGGVYTPVNLNAFHYAGLNPLKYVDPNGSDFYLLYQTGGAGHLGFAVDHPTKPGYVIRADYGMVNYSGGSGGDTKAMLWPFSSAFVNYREEPKKNMRANETLTFKSGKTLDAALVEKIKSTIVTKDDGSLQQIIHKPGKKEYKYYEAEESYYAPTASCADYCEDILSSATGGEYSTWFNFTPKAVFEDMKENKEKIQGWVKEHEKELVDRSKQKGSD